MSATPSRPALPARHRGRTAASTHFRRIAIAAAWIAAALAAAGVIADYRPAWLIAIVGGLLIAAGALAALARLRDSALVLEQAVAFLNRR